jgi:hypothetical protein
VTFVVTELERLVGHWRSRGRTVDGLDVAGTDTYEWFPGNGFLVHHVDVTMGDEQVRVLEMIGGSAPDGGWRMRAFDNQGGYGEMVATAAPDGGLTFADPRARATVTFAGPDAMAAHWERLVDGRWEPWMDMEFTRQD